MVCVIISVCSYPLADINSVLLDDYVQVAVIGHLSGEFFHLQ